MEKSIIIKNGSIVYSDKIIEADIAVSGGKIVEIGKDLDPSGYKCINAADKFILPGVIDPHVHPVYLDDQQNTSKSGAFGGVTTVVHYAYAKIGDNLIDVIKSWKEEGLKHSYVDFALHGGLFETIKQLEDIPEAISHGVTSFKMFMAYAKLGWMTDDYALIKAMDVLGSAGGLACLHAENGNMIDYIQDKMLEDGVDFLENFVESRPAVTEMEAIFRSANIGKYMNCPVYIPHISSAEGIQMVRELKDKGFHIYAETCPHYLSLTWDELKHYGPLGKVGPCIRQKKDQDALWAALMDGTLDAIGSDHAPKGKKISDDFFDAPYGSPQIETMLPVLWHEGVNTGRMPPQDIARLLSENNAQILGIGNRKGRLDIGMDADMVVYDPHKEWTIKAENQHTNADYSVYEGREIRGKVNHVMNRGRMIIEENEFVAECGEAEFLKTDAAKWLPSNIRG